MSIAVTPAISQLDDLGLALLICLIGEQHCIIRASEHFLSDVEAEVQFLASSVFLLDCASVVCEENTKGEDFLAAFEHHEDDAGSDGKMTGKVCHWAVHSFIFVCRCSDR